jgi:hypothetical protein
VIDGKKRELGGNTSNRIEMWRHQKKKYVVLAIYMFLIILFMYNIEKKNTPDYKAAEAKKKVI